MADTAQNCISAVTAMRTALANPRHERFIPMGSAELQLAVAAGTSSGARGAPFADLRARLHNRSRKNGGALAFTILSACLFLF